MRSWLALLALFQLASANDSPWELLWSDEFDGKQLNENAWTKETGFLGYNSEFQTYTDRPENVYVEDGKLHIAAIRDHTAQVGYTSGRINTMDKVQVKYAMVEASIKIPDMKMGLWPAFWTLGQNYPEVGWPKAGELDILEAGQKLGSSLGLGNRRIVTAVHWDAYGEYVVEDSHIDMPYNLSAGFHNYKMIWQPDFVEMYVDNNLVQRTRIADCSTLWDCPELHQYHYLILNLAVSGMFTCCEYGFDLNEYPNGTAWTMEIDYVRVYGNEHTEIKLPEPTEAPAVTQAPSLAAVPTNTTATQAIDTTPAPTPAPITTVVTGSPTASLTVMTTTDQPSSSLTESFTANPSPGPSHSTIQTSSPTLDVGTSIPTSMAPTLEPSIAVNTGSPSTVTESTTITFMPSLRPSSGSTTASPSDAATLGESSLQTSGPTEDTILGELEELLLPGNATEVTDSPTAVDSVENITSSPTMTDDGFGFSNDVAVQKTPEQPVQSPSVEDSLQDLESDAGPQLEQGLKSAGYRGDLKFWMYASVAVLLLAKVSV